MSFWLCVSAEPNAGKSALAEVSLITECSVPSTSEIAVTRNRTTAERIMTPALSYTSIFFLFLVSAEMKIEVDVYYLGTESSNLDHSFPAGTV